ncbi:MAG: Asp-tRNA(Asn)/Glu-tRNA(Gln) amidotransferase subunit GatA [Candidatus Micrarchaeia archaeon]
MNIVKNVERKAERIRVEEPKIGAFIDVFVDDALRDAQIVEKKILEGRAGKLAGLVIGIKNNICIAGKRATCASKMLENYVAPYSATVVERILKEDGVIIGTCNMDEFACGSDTTKSAFHITRNPHDLERVPGGSSGGSAAAVAAGFVDASLGSDTGGSIRCPASFCGVPGFKPTYGAVSRYGLIDMGMSLDQIGPLAKNVKTLRILFSVIEGRDDRDATTLGRGCMKREWNGLKGLKVGVPREFFEGCDEKVSERVRDGIGLLESHGAKIMNISIPHARYSVPIYYLLMFAEFSSAMQRYDGMRYGLPADVFQSLVDAVSAVRDSAFGVEVKRRIMLGTYITMKEYRDAWYTKTLRARGLLQREFGEAFSKCDIIVGPAMPCVAWKIGEKSDNPIEMYLSDMLTVIANIVGVPAGVMPCGKIGSLPVGIQFHAKKREDYFVLDLMQEFEDIGGRL